MKLLHTSDWHLGASDGHISLYEDQKHFIDEISDIVSGYGIDAVMICGDIFDRAVSSAEAVRLYDHAMTHLCMDLKVPVLCIAGNHDSADRLESCGDLLAASGLYISGTYDRDIRKVSFDDAEVYMLPWITEEKVKSIFPEKRDQVTSLEDAFRTVTDHIREADDFDSGRRHIIMAHAFIVDAETSSSDRSAEIGSAVSVPADVFEGFDYAALGHLHKQQEPVPGVRYSGTPMPYSFGKEETQEKSVTVIDTSDMSQTVIPLSLLHLRTTLEGTLDELMHPECSYEVRNGYVRLRVTDQTAGLDALSELRKIYPNLLEVSGRTFEGDGSDIQLTPEELEELESDPVEVFRRFCSDEMGFEPDEHFTELFEKAVSEVENDETAVS